jgi:gliding motility-associated-like protein
MFRLLNILFLLVWAVNLTAQTNNFFKFESKFGFGFDKVGDFELYSNLVFHNEVYDFTDFNRYGISNWQGSPLLYSDGSNFRVLPHNTPIPNSSIITNYKITGGGGANDVLMTTFDTSNYLILHNNQTINSSSFFLNPTPSYSLLYSCLKRTNNHPSGFEMPESLRNKPINSNQILIGSGATRDSTGQPVIVNRTYNGLYSYKVLKGGEVIKMDSFSDFIFKYSPDTVLENNGNMGFKFRTTMSSSHLPVINHAGNKIIYVSGYHTLYMGVVIENYQTITIVDFDKHTGKFSNPNIIYQHLFNHFIPNPEKEYMTPWRFYFSTNDSKLYILAADFEYLPQVLNNQQAPTPFHIKKGTILFQVDLSSPQITFTKIHEYGYNGSGEFTGMNHLGQLVFVDRVGSNMRMNRIKSPNLKYPYCKIELEYFKPYPTYDPDFGVVPVNMVRGFYHIFDFLRIEQQYDYSCSATVQLRNTSLPDIGFTKYKWHIKDQNDSLMVFEQFEPPPLTYTQNGNYAVQLFAQSPKGGGYGEWYIDTIRVRIPTKPIARFSASDTVVCQHLPVTFNNLSTDQQTHTPRPKEYLWDFGDGNTSAETNPIHTYTQPGDYTVSLHFRNGYCDSLLVKTHYIHVVDAPKPGFSISDTQGCVPMTISITDTTRFRVQSKEYYFSDIDQWLPMTRDTFNHTFHSSGVFRVVQKLIGISGCVIVTDSVWVSAAPGITTLDTTSIHLVDVQNPMVNIFWKSHPAAVSYELQSGESMTNLSLLHQTPDTFFAHTVASAEFYQVQAVDSCGNKSVVGNYAKPVWLIGKVRGYNQAAELYHTPYEVWSGSEKRYHLQKFVVGNWITLRTEPFPLPYDDVNFTEKDSLQSCYRIQITDPNEASLVSHSNVLCLDYVPMLYLPNAFSPNGDGLNDVFELNTIGITTYTMRVFNQWGQKVFEGLNSSWDGTFQGMECPAGVYMVLLSYTNKSGKQFETGNTLHLIR